MTIATTRILLIACLAAAVSACQTNPVQAPARETFDVLITNGRVIDGTGAPWFRADVGITGDRIAAMVDLSAADAARRVDAAGRVVAPGFIDLLGQSEFNVLVDSRAAMARPRTRLSATTLPLAAMAGRQLGVMTRMPRTRLTACSR